MISTNRMLLFFYRLLTVIEFDLQKTFFQYLKLLKENDSFLKAADKNMICIDRFEPDNLGLYRFDGFYNDEYQKYNCYFGSNFISQCFDKLFLDFSNNDDYTITYDILLKRSGDFDTIKLYLEWDNEFLIEQNPRKYIDFLRMYFNRLYVITILKKMNFEILLRVDYDLLEIFFKKKINSI